MYRIRRQSGDEITLASMDELAAAIAAGRVTAEAEIYHQRAERWLAIASHPHFKMAAERAQALARPEPRPAPAAGSAPEPGAAPLRLVRNDDGGAGPKVTARWKEPPRLVKQPMALRAPSSAVPAPAPETHASPQPEAPRVDTPRPKSHVERATDGLPLLDVGALPPLPPRESSPRPRTGPLFDKAKLGVPTPMPQRAATPRPAPTPRAPTPAPRPEAIRAPTPMPAVAPRAPTPAPAPLPAPEPPVAAAPRVATPMPTRMPTPMPAPLPPVRPMLAEPEESLDVPPPVRDFSAPYVAPAATMPEPVAEAPRVPTPAPEPLPVAAAPVAVAEPVLAAPMLAAPAEPEIELVVDAAVSDEVLTLSSFESEPRRARWPMLVGAAAILLAVGFVMLRPRASVEPLAPKPVTTQPAAATAQAAAPVTVQPASTAAEDDATTGRAPAYVVELPDAPPPQAAAAAPAQEPVVPAAPKLSGVAPMGTLAPGLGVDAVAEQRQRSLEATRRQIDAQLHATP